MLPGQMRLLAPHHRWAELLAVLSDRGTTAIRYTVHQNLCTGCCKPCPTSLLFQANSRESLPFLPMFPVRWKEVHLKRSFPECCGIWKFTQGSLCPAGEIFWCGSVLACRRGCVVRVKLLCAPEEGASASPLGSGIFSPSPSPQRPSCLWIVASWSFFNGK